MPVPADSLHTANLSPDSLLRTQALPEQSLLRRAAPDSLEHKGSQEQGASTLSVLPAPTDTAAPYTTLTPNWTDTARPLYLREQAQWLTGESGREGLAGEPVPYRLRSDDLATSVLLLLLFTVVWAVVRHAAQWRAAVADLLLDPYRLTAASPRAESPLGPWLLLAPLVGALSGGILAYDMLSGSMPHTLLLLSERYAPAPYLLMLGAAVALLALALLKLALFQTVAVVFFSAAGARLLRSSYLLTLALLTLVAMPLALLAVYFNIEPKTLCAVLISAYALGRILLIYRAKRIFFNYAGGGLHLFLYFCALDLVPSAVAVTLLRTAVF